MVAQRLRLFRPTLRASLEKLISDYAAIGMLESGMCINGAAETVSESIELFSDELISEVRGICTDPEAFELVRNAVKSAIGTGEELFWPIVMAATGKPERQLDPAVERAVNELIADLKSDVEMRLGIAKIDFVAPVGRELPVEVTQGSSLQSNSKNGRPPAEFWDDLWAAMAIDLYTGALVPKSQADIERAMNDWISGRELSCATSTVRKRARKLWDGLRAVD